MGIASDKPEEIVAAEKPQASRGLYSYSAKNIRDAIAIFVSVIFVVGLLAIILVNSDDIRGIKKEIDAIRLDIHGADIRPNEYDDNKKLDELMSVGEHTFSNSAVATLAYQRIKSRIEFDQYKTHQLIEKHKAANDGWLPPYGTDTCVDAEQTSDTTITIIRTSGKICDGFEHNPVPGETHPA